MERTRDTAQRFEKRSPPRRSFIELDRPDKRKATWLFSCQSSSMTAKFEWDFEKDAENQQKHGVSFSLAQEAFRILSESLLVILHTANRRSALLF